MTAGVFRSKGREIRRVELQGTCVEMQLVDRYDQLKFTRTLSNSLVRFRFVVLPTLSPWEHQTYIYVSVTKPPTETVQWKRFFSRPPPEAKLVIVLNIL